MTTFFSVEEEPLDTPRLGETYIEAEDLSQWVWSVCQSCRDCCKGPPLVARYTYRMPHPKKGGRVKLVATVSRSRSLRMFARSGRVPVGRWTCAAASVSPEMIASKLQTFGLISHRTGDILIDSANASLD